MSPLRIFATMANTARCRLSKGIRLGRSTWICPDCRLEAPIRIGPRTRLQHCTIGRGTYLVGDASLVGVRMGRFCSVGRDLGVVVGIHPTSGWASTHPAFFSTDRQSGFTFADRQILPECRLTDSGWNCDVGHDVWIGNRVTIIGGVTVGTGAIIGAGSVVTRNLDPYTIYAGVPARPIRRRCSPEEEEALLESRWWERDFSWLSQHWQAFSSIPALMAALKDDSR